MPYQRSVAALTGIVLMPMTSTIAAARLIRARPHSATSRSLRRHGAGETQDEADADPAGVDGASRGQRPGRDRADDQRGHTERSA